MTPSTAALLLAGLINLASASTATSALLHQPTDSASQARIFGFAKADGSAKICSLHCDGRSPSLAQGDLKPVADRSQGRVSVSLHVSELDVMAWASVKGAARGDSVWVERSWNPDKSDAEKLGTKGIKNSKTSQTDMYNLADTSGHRRGLVRACTNAGSGSAKCTDWAYEKACELDEACDGGDTPDPSEGYFPVPGTSLDGRTLELHMNDQGLAWGTIRAAQPGDEVWIQRAWDADTTNQVITLGRVEIPEEGNRADTKLFSSRDVKLLMFGGALRACGKTDKITTCTNWARPNLDHAAAATDALMYDLQIYTAWWLSSWWNSAVATHTIIEYMLYSGDEQYLWLVDRSYTINRLPYAAGTKSGDELLGEFLSRAIDDALWWGLAWADAYELTGNKTYLEASKIIADYGHEFYDEGTCGGGVWWDAERTYKNAVTNGQYIKLSAQLHRLIDGDTEYLKRAQTGWDWYVNSGIISDADGLVNDGLTDSCENNNGTVWTYNQGLGIGAGLEIWRVTGDEEALEKAMALADAALEHELTVDGILTESCDAAGTCDDNQKQFKGIFMRYMADLAQETGEAKFVDFVHQQAATVWSKNRDGLNRLGQRWSGGSSNNVHDWRTQASALGALIADLRVS
ncbi:glycosyl hydrolase family 76 domain-containing protein [Sarocladium implicatum]|nr:glycosyl hydrolase family 76 domain-containing protein [Sarocladium implicatum]